MFFIFNNLGIDFTSNEYIRMQNLHLTPNLSRLLHERNLKKEAKKLMNLEEKEGKQSQTHRNFKSVQNLSLPRCKSFKNENNLN